MPKLPSSKEIIRTLEKHGFVSQRGSHAKYRSGEHTVIITTLRKEIPLGTFRSIVRQSGLSLEDFKK